MEQNTSGQPERIGFSASYARGRASWLQSDHYTSTLLPSTNNISGIVTHKRQASSSVSPSCYVVRVIPIQPEVCCNAPSRSASAPTARITPTPSRPDAPWRSWRGRRTGRARAPDRRRIARDSGAVLAIVSGEEAAARLHLTDGLGRIVRLQGEVSSLARPRYDPRPPDRTVESCRLDFAARQREC